MTRTASFDLAYLRTDAEGNEVHTRTLPNGESYRVIKDFPNEDDKLDRLEGWADDIEYRLFPALGRWAVTHAVRP